MSGIQILLVLVEVKISINLQKGLEQLDQLIDFSDHPDVGFLLIGDILLEISDILLEISDLRCLLINDSSQSCFLIKQKHDRFET